ncbi:TPA: glycosyltransferase family 2 protein [Photobacterium damselae]
MNNTYSVLIVTWNRSFQLKRAIDSICNQSLIPTEVVIVDNNSTDDTSKIVKDFDKKLKSLNCKLKYIRLHKNIGCPPARNIGLVNCSSKYIYSLDDDGFLDENALLEMDKLLAILDEPYIIASEIRSPSGDIITSYSNKICEKYNFSAGACLISKKCIEEGFIFPDYFRQMEESKLLYSLWYYDKKVVINPFSIMFHDKILKGRMLHNEVRLNFLNDIENISRQVSLIDSVPIFFFKAWSHFKVYCGLRSLWSFTFVYDFICCLQKIIFNKREIESKFNDYMRFKKNEKYKN